MSKDYLKKSLSIGVLNVCCFALALSSIGYTFLSPLQAVYAETANAGKLVKLEKLYELSGAKERINANLQVAAIMQAESLEAELEKKLGQLKYPQVQAEKISQAKADLFKSKMNEKVAPLVNESLATYKVYTDSNLTEPDIDFLLQYYTSDSVKAFNEKAKTLSENISKPLMEEIQSYLKGALDDAVAGKAHKPFPVPDKSKEIAAIDQEKLGTIKSILHSTMVVDNVAGFFKTTFDSVAENATSAEEKKFRQNIMSGIPYKTIVRPLVVIAYDKNFTEEELNGVDTYLSDARMTSAKPHMVKAEEDIMNAIVPKYEKMAELTAKEVVADLLQKPAAKSAAGKAAAGKPSSKPAAKAPAKKN